MAERWAGLSKKIVDWLNSDEDLNALAPHELAEVLREIADDVDPKDTTIRADFWPANGKMETLVGWRPVPDPELSQDIYDFEESLKDGSNG